MQRLALARQTFIADKNQHGSISRRERDETWELKRQQDDLRQMQNRRLRSKVKSGVEHQKYITNIQRFEDIKRASLERHEHEKTELQNLS